MNDPGFDLASRTAAFLRDQLAHPFSLQVLEEHLGHSSHHICRVFKQKTGQSPQKYSETLRMDAARSLLLEGKLKREAIAKQVGYRDVFYFSKVFKKVTGTTPGKYVKHLAGGM